MKQVKKYTLTLLLVLAFNFTTAQKIYKEIQGSYENPHIGDVTLDGYELTYGGNTYIYKTETDNGFSDNYVSYSTPGEKGTVSVRVTYNGNKYIQFSDGEYILIPKGKTAQEDKAAQEAKKNNMDALMGGFSDDDGKVTGDPNASGYYGTGGEGSGGNHRLGNRKAKAMPSPDYPCNEQGRVVVTITVNQSGSVISAVPGAKGTTNVASCLLIEAKKAAMSSKFNADSNAPSKQVGEIIYNFSLSD